MRKQQGTSQKQRRPLRTRRQQYAAIDRFRAVGLDLDAATKHTAYLAKVDPIELAVAHLRREIGRYERLMGVTA
jgi:hypothetical protein